MDQEKKIPHSTTIPPDTVLELFHKTESSNKVEIPYVNWFSANITSLIGGAVAVGKKHKQDPDFSFLPNWIKTRLSEFISTRENNLKDEIEKRHTNKRIKPEPDKTNAIAELIYNAMAEAAQSPFNGKKPPKWTPVGNSDMHRLALSTATTIQSNQVFDDNDHPICDTVEDWKGWITKRAGNLNSNLLGWIHVALSNCQKDAADEVIKKKRQEFFDRETKLKEEIDRLHECIQTFQIKGEYEMGEFAMEASMMQAIKKYQYPQRNSELGEAMAEKIDETIPLLTSELEKCGFDYQCERDQSIKHQETIAELESKLESALNLAKAYREERSHHVTRLATIQRYLADSELSVNKYKQIYFSPTGDNHHNALVCPYCNPQGHNITQIQLQNQVEKQSQELKKANDYAEKLIKFAFPDCEPIEDIEGKMTQLDNIITGHKKQLAQHNFISVDERLPVETGDYLVKLDNGYLVKRFTAENNCWAYWGTVVAWMPIPTGKEAQGA